ncbi:MAG TPA: HNH endonuclease signature motif containing protein [Nostocaceae cyanobacterium]|nr:HNH endonuclease signature motif containing protein [Nostocaceae cyanobacterium]
MSSISEAVRERVRQRAENRCEYCLSYQDYIMGRLQIDHIQPLVKGGVDTEDNLCLACELFNQYKWTQTQGLDPENGEIVSLFNPRQQKWKEHFTWDDEGVKSSV